MHIYHIYIYKFMQNAQTDRHNTETRPICSNLISSRNLLSLHLSYNYSFSSQCIKQQKTYLGNTLQSKPVKSSEDKHCPEMQLIVEVAKQLCLPSLLSLSAAIKNEGRQQVTSAA